MKNKNFLQKLADNLSAGVHVVSDKIVESSKENYKASQQFFEQTKEQISDYQKRKDLEHEIEEIEEKQKSLVAEFGALCLDHYIKKDNLHKRFLTTERVDKIVENFKANNEKIKKLNNQISSINQ